jgi:putative nucleotidyltransferase with HDIG domain
MDNSEKELTELIVKLVNKSEISSIKQVVTEILKIIRDESSSAKDLKNIVEKDPPLCAKVLKLANSAQYGYPKSISDIQEAIICIGFDAVKELALHQKVCELFMKEGTINGYTRLSLWKHCLAVAICCKMIYRREFRERGDSVYVAGLLHDLGIIVEDQFFQELFEQALQKSAREQINLYTAERATLKIDHAAIARAIADDWDFPDELIYAMGLHHEPTGVKAGLQKIVYTVYIADFICQREKIGYVDAPFRDVDPFNKCLSSLGIKVKALDIIVEELQAEIKKMDQMGWFIS